MNNKKAKALRRLARDEFINRVQQSPPDAQGARRGLRNGLVHNPREERSAIVHPESLRGIELIAKRVYTQRKAKGLPV